MKIATWNVNSIRAREARVLQWLEARRPDVVCLQELKVPDAGFPRLVLEAAGYHAAVHGQRTYNGVAILARRPPTDVERGLPGDEQARLVSARVEGVRVICAYFPNGGEVGSDKWSYKLDWMQRLAALLRQRFDPGEPLLLAGDFNVAPEARDVCDPGAWESSVLCHPDARAALEEIRRFGLVDLVRLHHAGPGPWTWWDYKQLAFPRDQGLRIDHLFASQALAGKCVAASVDRDVRKPNWPKKPPGASPSDHAPVMAELSL
jgi:exodeoxyribonuclease III